MNLQGKTACQVQRDLRKELVLDLQEGNDTAAFVCSQLGINNAPRADQIELMIAAMPGVASLTMQGAPAESDIDTEAWTKYLSQHTLQERVYMHNEE